MLYFCSLTVEKPCVRKERERENNSGVCAPVQQTVGICSRA